VNNDSSLFLAARTAGMVRISVKDHEDEIAQKGGSINGSLWWNIGTSGINVWCDYCLKIVGAQAVFGKLNFSFFLQKNHHLWTGRLPYMPRPRWTKLGHLALF